jgi:hypothetical protein
MLLSILLAALAQGTTPGAEWQVLPPESVEAQTAFERFGDAYSGAPEANWKSSSLARAWGELEDLPATPTLAEVSAAIAAARARVAESAVFDEHNGPRIRRHLLLEIDGVLRAMALTTPAPLDSEPLDWETARTFVSGRFERESATLTVDDVPDDATFVTDSMFFAGEPSQVVLRLDLKSGLGGATPFAYYATLEQAIEFRAAAARMLAIFGTLVQPQFERTAQRLGEIDAGWTNYLEHGFSQYPWESWANGWLTDFAWSRPPRSQWVLLHPELGLVFDTRSTRSAEMEAALLVHGLGYVRYFGDERDWFAGLSATASITDDASYGWGFGPTLHFGHARLASRVPHVSVSVLWHDFEDGGNEPVLAATLDLWRLVDRGNELLYQSRLMR